MKLTGGELLLLGLVALVVWAGYSVYKDAEVIGSSFSNPFA